MNTKFKRKVVSAATSPRHAKRPHKEVKPQVKEAPKQVDIFDGTFDSELAKIPAHMHQKVAYLVEKNVELRVNEYMNEFRKELDLQLRQQHREDQYLIQKLLTEKSQGPVLESEPESTKKPSKASSPKNNQRAQSPSVIKNVPQVIVELSKGKDNPIGGLPFKAWEQAQESQYQRNNVNKSPLHHKTDFQDTMSNQLNDWKQGLRSGEQSLRGSMTSRKMNDEESRLSRGFNDFGSSSVPVSPRAKSRQGNQQKPQATGQSNDRVIPQTQLFLTQPNKIKIMNNSTKKDGVSIKSPIGSARLRK